MKLAEARGGAAYTSIMNFMAIKEMAMTLPDTKEDVMRIEHVTRANYEKFGPNFLAITKKYREMAVQAVLNATNALTQRGVKRNRSFGSSPGMQKIMKFVFLFVYI